MASTADSAPPSKKKPRPDDDIDDAAPAAEEDFCADLLESACAAHPSAAHLARAAARLAAADYDGAVRAANAVLGDLPSLPAIARAALLRGRAIVAKAQRADADGEAVAAGVYEKAWNAFGLASRLDPECAETVAEMDALAAFLRDRAAAPDGPDGDGDDDDHGAVDVLVVGAGPSGVGTALLLTETFGLARSRVLLVERGDAVGETFRRWPAEMRFISPSFNQQGWTDAFDLNAIAHGSSPAFSLHREHPSGAEYAAYLAALATTHKLPVRLRTEVEGVACVRAAKDAPLPLFAVDVRTQDADGGAGMTETIFAHYIVWAAGEFQYPNATAPIPKSTASAATAEEKKDEEPGDAAPPALPGSEHCLHNSHVDSWAKLEGDDFLVIGGYESGVDAAVNLARAGKRCRVLASTPCWDVKTADPSTELAPYTAARLAEVLAPGFAPRPRLYAPLRAVKVEPAAEGGYNVTAEWQAVEEAEDAPLRAPLAATDAPAPGAPGTTLVLHTPRPPVLATGFRGSVRAAVASHLFAFADDDHPRRGCLGDAPLLTGDDESTAVPGVFLVGPQVKHDALSFCFVYKFRQRFAVVAHAICEGLGIDTRAAVAECRGHNMYLDDFQTCEDTCGDVC